MDQKWLETCVQAGEFLYGFFPVEHLQKMYETKEADTPSIGELIEGVRNSDQAFMEYREGQLKGGQYENSVGFLAPVLFTPGSDRYEAVKAEADGGNPYALLHVDEVERRYLLEVQKDTDYYLPTESEIQELVDTGYIWTPEYDALVKKLRKYGVTDDSFMATLWEMVSTEEIDHNQLIKIMVGECCRSGASQEAVISDVLHTIVNFHNNVNKQTRRGWTPTDLLRRQPERKGPMIVVPGSTHMAKKLRASAKELSKMGVKVDFDASLGQFVETEPDGEKRIVKVYPNDPCPCGSGKKYKKCHGRLAASNGNKPSGL